MFYLPDINKLLDLFNYNEYDPLLFTTTFFLFIFFFFLIIYRLFSSGYILRVTLLLLFSFFFYYKVSGLFVVLLIGSAIANYILGQLLGNVKPPISRRLIFITGILLNLSLLGYFKYTNFFIQVITDFKLFRAEPLDILLPIGISFYTFKALSYLIDVYWETIQPEKNFLNFTLYITFFANVLAGPIDRAGTFLPQINKAYHISKAEMGIALYFLVSGIFKKAVIADYISINFVDRVFDYPLRFTGVENLLAVYGYTLQVYCDFSGYTDIATGLALLLGYKLMENFRSPYQSLSIAEFWRRWHISLSAWLLDYLFRPLQIKFRNYRLAGNAGALLITFILCGLWHGASWTFLFWGFLHGFYMTFSLITAGIRKKIPASLGIENSRLLKIIQGLITFHFIAFAWIFFRAQDFKYAGDMLNQITGFFNAGVLMQFINAYPVVIFLILTGYILHLIPRSFELKTQRFLGELPLTGKALILALVIWLAAQFRESGLLPFIYFDF
jgi:alginate O-acetyltransferase complex protein AlgI